MKRMATAILLLAVLGCTQKPKPVSSEAEVPLSAAERPAIEVLYAGVPTLQVHQNPDETAPAIATYGYTESVSVLQRNGEWAEVRTFDGSGWVKYAELINGDQVKNFTDKPIPRFYVEPARIDRPRARGTITFEAKVNTAGEVFDVKTLSNTTGIKSLADDNAKALQAARFYPMIDKGTRKTFIYQYSVYY